MVSLILAMKPLWLSVTDYFFRYIDLTGALYMYSRTSMARTLMARLSRLFRTSS